MDVSSIRSLVVLVIQLQTIISCAQELSEEVWKEKSKGSSSNQKQQTCCYNGGLCVLGSFCHCPKEFYGRYCEHRVSERSCRHVQHGIWVKAGCNLCCCVDGYMDCLPRAFDGCDDKPITEEQPGDSIWDYEDQMVIFASIAITTTSKYDAEDAEYYDYYDTRRGQGEGGGESSGGSRTVMAAADFSLVMVVALCCGVVVVTRIVCGGVFSSWRLVGS